MPHSRRGSRGRWYPLWDEELMRYGELITEARSRYVAQLLPRHKRSAGTCSVWGSP